MKHAFAETVPKASLELFVNELPVILPSETCSKLHSITLLYAIEKVRHAPGPAFRTMMA